MGGVGGGVGCVALLFTISPWGSLSWAPAGSQAPDPPAEWEGGFQREGRGKKGEKPPAQVCRTCLPQLY